MKDYKKFYERCDVRRYILKKELEDDEFYKELLTFIKKYNLENKKILEIGCGTGMYQDIVEDYVGIDVAEHLRKYFHKPFFVIEEGKPYPFPNETFDAVFTRATFEHIPNINFGLKEMLRVLKRNGYILFHMAWWVRPWASKGLVVRQFNELCTKDKIIKLSIPFREFLPIRFLNIALKRTVNTLHFLINKENFKYNLKFKKLKPNYKIKWCSDSDACNSVDPHSAILFFKANNCEVIKYNSLFKSLFVKYESLTIRKL